MDLDIEIISNMFYGTVQKNNLPVKNINRFIRGVISSPSLGDSIDFTIESCGNKYEVFLDSIYDDDTFYIDKCPENIEELTYFLESLTYRGF